MCYNKMKNKLRGRVKMKIIDSHVHLNLQQFDNDREEVFKRIEEKLDFVKYRFYSSITSTFRIFKYFRKY